MVKRLVSILLSIFIIVGIFPITISAESVLPNEILDDALSKSISLSLEGNYSQPRANVYTASGDTIPTIELSFDGEWYKKET